MLEYSLRVRKATVTHPECDVERRKSDVGQSIARVQFSLDRVSRDGVGRCRKRNEAGEEKADARDGPLSTHANVPIVVRDQMRSKRRRRSSKMKDQEESKTSKMSAQVARAQDRFVSSVLPCVFLTS